MRALSALVAGAAMAGTLVARAADPPELTRARLYLSTYQRLFASLVAEELSGQTVRLRGQTMATRGTRGEFFTAFIEAEGVWMSVRDVAEVDGAPATDRIDVRSLLASQTLRRVAPSIAAANARYNLGSLPRNINEPTLALQLLASRRQADVVFSRQATERPTSGPALVTFGMRLRDGVGFVHNPRGRPVTTRGSMVVEADTGRIRRTSLSFEDQDISAEHETTYAPDDRIGMWLPVTFVETYRAGRTGEITTVRTTFSNYRRFETGGRLLKD